MLGRPANLAGLRHVALFIVKFEETLHFYTQLLGMAIEWQPDPDNIYLCSGCDNLALHRYVGEERPLAGQRLDHIGFVIDKMEDVDHWHEFLKGEGVLIKAAPRTHRDGARSFYCADPDGNIVQLIFHPPISSG